MKVTFITTVYNRLEYLRNIMKCLINQTFQVDEFIIADDGSREKVIEFIEDLLPECSFKVKHVYQEDLGFRAARSRNNGAREAEGELLIYCDQDVIFGKTYIEEIVENSKRGTIMPFKVLWSTFEEKEEIQELLDRGELYKKVLLHISDAQKMDRNKQIKRDSIRSLKYRFKLRKKPITVGGASFALFKEDYIRVNGFNEEFKGHGNEDLDFGFRLQKSGVNPRIIKFSEAPIHMAHPKDPTAGSNEEKLEETKKTPEMIALKCVHGYINSFDTDKYKVRVLK
ncbi:glycosyl transferase [Propionigenium maris DSM 9537]|uniref:Glycosyl transferase n=1 Tax=Propionigenium maris DSM 9537 TaxID=1123000 RepID=A0A9W6GJV4_9FUSO|nr:glycosyltransferase [Propionigenium maris]GLI55166.1 glycosyl transferase [Propionigenium maris DSM 9537]